LRSVLRDQPGLRAEVLAYVYDNLGSLCQDQRRFGEANRYYQRSITEWERAGKAHQVALARTLNNQASLLWETGRLVEAERVLGRSSALQMAAVGSNQAEAAHWLFNLGTLHLNENSWAEAEAAYRRFLAIEQAGADPLKVAVAASNLGLICRKAERNAQAVSLFAQAWKIWEQARSRRDLEPLLLMDLATSFLSANLVSEAEAVGARAVGEMEVRFGVSHARTAKALTLYAAVLRKARRKAEARVMEKRARAIESGDAQLRASRETVDVAELHPRGTWNPIAGKRR
jgi:tetratricopeptide (TPR) repeat protein